jgi:chromosome segregation ATPase
MRLEMQTLQDQVRSLETQQDDDRKNAAQELSSLATQLQKSREANRALAEANRALMDAKGSDDSTSKADLDQLNSRVRDLTAANDKLRSDQQRLADQLKSQASDLESARAAARAPAGWTQERDNLRAQVEDMFTKLSNAERGLAQLKSESEAARTEAQNAQGELATLKAKLADSDKAVETNNGAVAELTGLNQKLTDDKTALQAQLAQMKAAADRAQADIADLKARNAASDRSAEQQTAALASANDKLQTQLKSVTDELAGLKAKLADSEKAAEEHGSSVAELTGANQKLTTDNKNLQAQIDTLSTQLAALRTDSARLAQSEQARQDAEQRVASLDSVTAQLARTQRDLAGLRDENARLNDTVQAIDRDRTTRIAQLQQDNNAISARLRQAQGTLDQIASAARIINGASANFGGSPTPTVATTAPAPALAPDRIHTVAEGDSLTRISLRYYGTPNRWQEIYDANRDVLKGENALRPGQRLKIP